MRWLLPLYLFATAAASAEPAPTGYPLCGERSQAAEWVRAAVARDQRWANAVGCGVLPAGDVVVLEPGFDVVRVRVLLPAGDSVVGYTVNWRNANSR